MTPTLPPPQAPFVDAPLYNLSQAGYQLLLKYILGGAAPQPTIANGLTATGSGQATALLLTADVNEITTVEPPLSEGVLLSFGPGRDQTVINQSPNDLSVYPAPDVEIDGLSANAPYSLAAGKEQTFYVVSSSQIFSEQLG
jgi:hypothetical protein